MFDLFNRTLGALGYFSRRIDVVEKKIITNRLRRKRIIPWYAKLSLADAAEYSSVFDKCKPTRSKYR